MLSREHMKELHVNCESTFRDIHCGSPRAVRADNDVDSSRQFDDSSPSGFGMALHIKVQCNPIHNIELIGGESFEQMPCVAIPGKTLSLQML